MTTVDAADPPAGRAPDRGRRRGGPVTGLRAAAGLAVGAAAVLIGCGGDGRGAGPEVQPVSLPDLTGMHEAVQAQLRDAHRAAAEEAAETAAARPGAAGDAWGRLGMLLLAGEYYDAAEPCLRNARRLAPERFRWAYYLGHLYRERGDLEPAVSAFTAALALRPRDLPALVRLIDVHFDLGQWDAAGPLLDRAHALAPTSAAVRFQLGRAALAAEDYAAAVDHLDAARRRNPDATVVHYPLGLAWRGLGDLDAARRHLDLSGGRVGRSFSPGVGFDLADPLMRDLRTALRSPQRHRTLALAADAAGDRAEAVRQFRSAVALAPDDVDLRVSLGLALDRAGEAQAALAALEAALDLDPAAAQAHYLIGGLLERAGRDAAAIDRYADAARHDPDAVEAHLRLADALARTGRVDAALDRYRRALAVDPASPAARFGEALALVRLARHRAARDRLEAAAAAHPDHPAFVNALARLLAASPDAGVRDGRRALDLIKPVVEVEQTTAVAETVAMALAEVGEFGAAVEWQRMAMTAARDGGRADLAARMTPTLDRYARGAPSRTPWRDDDPEYRPGPPVEPGLLDP